MKVIKNSVLCLFLFLLLPSIAAGSESGPWTLQSTLQTPHEKGVLSSPSALFFEPEKQKYYVTDTGNNRLVSFDQKGTFLLVFTALDTLEQPFDLSKNNEFIWVLEKGKNSLTRINLQTKEIKPFGLSAGNLALHPVRFEYEDDLFFVLDRLSGDVFQFDQKMIHDKTFRCDDCSSGFVDFKIHNGMLWAMTGVGDTLHVYTLDGTLSKKIQLSGISFEFPISFDVDSSDQIYIVDRHTGMVSSFSQTGSFKYSFSQNGAKKGNLSYPIELSFDPLGRMCIVEEGNGRVSIFSRKGNR